MSDQWVTLIAAYDSVGITHNMRSVREAGVAATTFQIEYDEEAAFFASRNILECAMTRATRS